MSKFNDIERAINHGKRAEQATEWFVDWAKMPDEGKYGLLELQVHYGVSTASGKAASAYLKEAFRELLPQIVKNAHSLKLADEEAAGELLRKLAS